MCVLLEGKMQMSKPIKLADKRINEEVTETSPGVYALDATTAGPFTVSRIGRSDTDLNNRLHDYVGEYEYFRFAYSSSPKRAFEAECELYHDHHPPDNVIHPDRPDGS